MVNNFIYPVIPLLSAKIASLAAGNNSNNYSVV